MKVLTVQMQMKTMIRPTLRLKSFFDEGYGSIAFLELKWLLGCSNITSIGLHARKIMELLQLCKIEKGSVSLQGKYNSLTSRQLRSKHNNKTESKVKKVQTYNDIY